VNGTDSEVVRMGGGWNWLRGCEDGRWIELAQDRVQWRALVLALLDLRVLLPES
jgi:hypothetical protein